MKVVYSVTYRVIFNAANGTEIPGKLLRCNVVAENTNEVYQQLQHWHRNLTTYEAIKVTVERLNIYECRWLLNQAGRLIEFEPIAVDNDWFKNAEEAKLERPE